MYNIFKIGVVTVERRVEETVVHVADVKDGRAKHKSRNESKIQ